MANRLINARMESAADKPTFRNALRRRRCLLPCSGYYEWKKLDKRKQPFWIRMKDAPLFAFAGLWESWNSPDGGTIESCALLTQDANVPMRGIHDRMPVILLPEEYDAWLDPAEQDGKAALKVLHPMADDLLEAIPVSSYVGNSRHEGPQCIAPPEAQ
jgi:putative SOS response-associated peptidase YedK